MYFSRYDMIVACEADRGTAGDGQSDCAVGGGCVMLCFISGFVICIE